MNHGQPITIVPAGYMDMPNRSIGLAEGGQVILAWTEAYDKLFTFVVVQETAHDAKEGNGHQHEKDESGIREGEGEGSGRHQATDERPQIILPGTGNEVGVAGDDHPKKDKQRRPVDVRGK